VQLQIEHSQYLAHRVAWFYVTGKWPENQIDHRDGDGWNNRFSNLRKATHTQNLYNQKRRPGGTGVKGIYWDKKRGAYVVQAVWAGAIFTSVRTKTSRTQKPPMSNSPRAFMANSTVMESV
jgi:hypothetical protein